MKFNKSIKLDFRDVLIKPRYSKLISRNDVELINNFKMKHTKKILTGIPIFVSNMDTTGTFQMAIKLAEYKIFTVIHKHYSFDEWKEFIDRPDFDKINNYLFISTGTRDYDLNKFKKIIKYSNKKIDKFCLDNANGSTENFVNHVKLLRQTYPQCILIAGNIATKFMGSKLLNAGADIIKYGIGSGSVCTTRIMTGCGYPQFSLILDCAKYIQNKGGLFLSDGGITNPGDIGKALSAGANFVMCGGIFSGHLESEKKIIENEKGDKFLEFYGMASNKAMTSHYPNLETYRANEGKLVLIPYKGNVENTLTQILGGLRSLCTYLGCKNISKLFKNARFIQVNNQSNEIFSKNASF